MNRTSIADEYSAVALTNEDGVVESEISDTSEFSSTSEHSDIIYSLNSRTDDPVYLFAYYTLSEIEHFNAEDIEIKLVSPDGTEFYPDSDLSTFFSNDFEQQQSGLIVYSVPQKYNNKTLTEVITYKNTKVEGKYFGDEIYD